MKLNRDKKLDEMRQKIKQSLFTKKEILNQKVEDKIPKKRSSTNASIQIEHQQTQIQKQRNHIQQKFQDLYEIGHMIGQGSNGIVKICFKKTQSNKLINFGHIPTKYAVKIIPKANEPEIINTIIQTFNINRELNGISSVIQAYDLFIDENENIAYWVMEYCEWKSLQYYQDKQLTMKQIREIIRQLVISVKKIHEKGICHRDIKPDNILVKLENQIKIKLIDFGVSKKYFNKNRNGIIIHQMWTRTGTILFQAPEIFLCGIYNEKIDIWACGVILYLLLCKRFPYHCETIIDTIEQITNETYIPWRQKEYQDLHYIKRDLLFRILNKDPIKRLSADEFLLHPWISLKKHQFDKAIDDLQILKRKSRQTEFKIATCLQLSDLLNPLKNFSPLYLNPMISSNSNVNQQNEKATDEHVFYNQKRDIKLNDYIMQSKKNVSGQNSFFFAIKSFNDNSPTQNKGESILCLEEESPDEIIQYRYEAKCLDKIQNTNKFSK